MKDYFAALIPTEVTGETGRNAFVKYKETGISNEYLDVTPNTFSQGNEGNKCSNSFHPVTHLEIDQVTLGGTITGTLHPLHLATLRNENLCYLYNERASIMESDGGASRNEAEGLAYQDALNTFLIKGHPEIVDQFESIIHQSF